MACNEVSFLAALTAALGNGAAYAETELTVYSAIEAEDLACYVEVFPVRHPDIKINWVRGSTGVVSAKLLAIPSVAKPVPHVP
ncbi:hypothetical protein [Shimia sediminis]|uniref:hypothetical protein n=1 Tax=Shimia sediminis TaxID=2497945 RepID=UPI0019816CE5|nr:hypothetical protein [Shimia sediminis]